MPAQPAELWAFYLAAITVGAILVFAVGAAVIVSQRRLSATTRAFATSQVAAAEEERRRVARELHDDVSQRIAVLSHQVESLRERLLGEPIDQAALETVDTVGDRLRGLAEAVRGLAHQMHPSMLDHLGLGAALDSLAREVTQGSELRLEVAIECPLEDLSPSAALCLYRVAQEGIRNTLRHAAATRGTVLVWRNGPEVVLEIGDDGTGFAPDRAAGAGGLGLLSMRERLRLTGGELTILSEPGRGTLITARIAATGRADR